MTSATITDRPTTLTKYHNYNLRNAGWPASATCSPDINGEFAPVTTDPVTHTNSNVSFYPALSDYFYSAKAQAVKSASNLNAYSPWELEKFHFGNTPAPTGHFLLNAFYRNRTDASGIPDLYEADRDLDPERCSSIEFYAGRVWYLKPNGEVLFSQILSDITRADRCYQDADPTAEEINDLLDTDGGVIRIRDIGEGKKLVANDNAIFVMASNGVWAISGTDQSGFTAANFQVVKITNAGLLSPASVVLAENNVYYWSKSGIYVIAPDQVTGRPTAQNITENTIQTDYLQISDIGKNWANGVYDSENRRIHWFHNSQNSSVYRFRYCCDLLLDTVLGAFYKWSLPGGRLSDGTPAHVAGAVQRATIGVTVTGEDDDRLKDAALKYFVVDEQSTGTYNYAWAEDRDLSFTDFATSVDGGNEFTTIIETGNDVLGDPTADKYGNYLYGFFERTEREFAAGELKNPSACNFRLKWEWADNESSNKWSGLQSAYYFKRPFLNETSGDFNYGHEVIQTKTRIRGNGKALRIRFESESGKDFKLLGWAIPFSGVTQR